ncbi:MAG: monooxygenase [Burkholderiales bacterium]|jgi:2-polyprenyl-6-methoxyphenol hydroxylase-like FAD-dependent oxidoreductase|nr:monooxygenase [Burkholderiales bacterium]
MRVAAPGTVVVIGAGIGGLLAAAAVAGCYQKVIVLDRDRLPDGPALRKGAPQGAHVHGVLASGQTALEALLPGVIDDVMAAGGDVGDMLADGLFYVGRQRLVAGQSGLQGLVASRPLLEWVIRRRVAALPNVEIRCGVEVQSLVHDAARQRVTGVLLAPPDATQPPSLLAADLVVDVAGRGSRCLQWLQQLGYGAPPLSRQPVDVTYTSCYFERKDTDLPGLRAVLCAHSADFPTASGMLEQEGERWVISCGAFANAAAPTDLEGFRAYLHRHAPPETAHVAAIATPLGTPVQFRYPASEHRHFERMPCFPAGYLVMGDALCSFNPVYGQGMTVAACEAVALRQCLQQGADHLAPRFFKACARLIAAPWEITVGSDLALPMVVGKRPFGFALMNRFMDRVVHAAQTDLRVAKALLAVIHLTAPSWSLLYPVMLWRVWRGGFAR